MRPNIPVNRYGLPQIIIVRILKKDETTYIWAISVSNDCQQNIDPNIHSSWTAWLNAVKEISSIFRAIE